MNYSKESSDFQIKSFNDFLIREKNQEVLILDSSVVFKWFYFENENSLKNAGILYEKASLRNLRIIAPELLLYEVVNIFKFRTKLSPEILEEIVKELLYILIFIKLDYKDYTNAYKISQEANCSIYDSIYIAVSEKYKAPFITADNKLFNALKPLNYNIVILEDFLNF